MARAPRKPSSGGEAVRQERRRRERLRRLEIEERPAGSSASGSSFVGAVVWRNTNQVITGTASGGAAISWNRKAGDASIVIDTDATKILVPSVGWWRAVFNGRADMTTNGLAGGKIRASVGWRDKNNSDHWVGEVLPLWSSLDSDWSISTPPVYVSSLSGTVMPKPYFHARLDFEGMTNPATLTAFGQDDSLLDSEGYPVGADVMRFSLEKL